eukprot:6108224-Karenia_brevis.AAC.1
MHLDQHGFRLCAASLPGDGWRDQHDALKWAIYQDMRAASARATPEVYGLFAPQRARDDLEKQPLRKR